MKSCLPVIFAAAVLCLGLLSACDEVFSSPFVRTCEEDGFNNPAKCKCADEMSGEFMADTTVEYLVARHTNDRNKLAEMERDLGFMGMVSADSEIMDFRKAAEAQCGYVDPMIAAHRAERERSRANRPRFKNPLAPRR